MTISQEDLDKMYHVYKEGYEDIEGVPEQDDGLGNPSVNGYVLSSTTTGVRSWVAQTGGMVYPAAGIPISLGPGLGWAASITNSSVNWDTAYTDRLKWDGGATGLTAATGRTSLGLGTAAQSNVGDFAASGVVTTHESTYNHTNYNTAYGWGNHASAGYLTTVPHATPAAWGTILLDSISSTKYFRGDGTWQSITVATPAPHNLIDTTGHPVSGLIAGHFLKATGATTYAFGAHGLTAGDVGASTLLHGHGNITSLGAIGSTATLPIITTTNGVLTVGSFGTTAGTFAQGNDTRFVSITPTPAEHQVTVWGGSATIKGMAGLTYDGTDFEVIGNSLASGDVVAYQDSGYTGSIWDSIPVDNVTIEINGDGELEVISAPGGAPTIHNLVDTTNHPVTGLTNGHFLKATGATTYGFAAHGLTYSDVGAVAAAHLSDFTHSNIHAPGSDNQDLSGYAPLASPTFTGTVTLPLITGGVVSLAAGDVNTVEKAGFYTLYATSNAPFAGDGGMISAWAWYANSIGGSRYNFQLACSLGGIPWYRTTNDIGAGTWYQLAPLASPQLTAWASITHATNPYLRLSKTDATARIFDIQISSDDFYITDATAGTHPFFIAGGTGNVGIGTTSGNGRLSVRGLGTTSSTYSFEAATSGGNTRFIVRDDGRSIFYGSDNAEKVTITETGNVGIGTTTPRSALDVNGSVIVGSHNGANQLYIERYSDIYPNAHIVAGYADNNVGVGIFLDPRNSAGTEFTSMALLSDGNVGIGTTAPERALHIKTATTSYGCMRVEATSGQESGINYRDGAGSDANSWTAGKGTGGIGDTFGWYWGGNQLTLSTGGNLTATGTVTATRLISNIATGTAPLAVTSTTKVDNLHVARATLADTVTVAGTSDTTSYVALFESATGNMEPKTSAGITYNATTGTFSCTGDIIAYAT